MMQPLSPCGGGRGGRPPVGAAGGWGQPPGCFRQPLSIEPVVCEAGRTSPAGRARNGGKPQAPESAAQSHAAADGAKGRTAPEPPGGRGGGRGEARAVGPSARAAAASRAATRDQEGRDIGDSLSEGPRGPAGMAGGGLTRAQGGEQSG